MTGERPDSRESLREHCEVEVYDHEKLPWDEIKARVLEIEASASGEYPGLEEEDLQSAFEDKNAVVILTRDVRDKRIVGFTFAEPSEKIYVIDEDSGEELYPGREASKDTAYVGDVALEEEYQEGGIIVPMNEELERQLIEKGYSFVEAHVSNIKDEDDPNAESLADKVRKNYAGRIELEEAVSSEGWEYGPQIFFRIKLAKSEEKRET